jgi:hypothetical protein
MSAKVRIAPAKVSTSKQNKENTDGTRNGAVNYLQKGENA